MKKTKTETVTEITTKKTEKYEVFVDCGDIISIWRYDPKFSQQNPYEMEQIYSTDPKFKKLKSSLK